MTDSAEGALGTDRASKRKAEKRERLLAAARKLFITRGYHETRPQDIAREADVAHGTFYSHFNDKREIFLAFASEAQEDLHNFVSSRVPEVNSFEEYLNYALTAIQEFAEQNPGLLRSALVDTKVFDPSDTTGKVVRSRFASGFIKVLERARKNGELYDDVDPELMGHAMMGMIQASAPQAYRMGKSREQYVSLMANFLTRGMVRNPERL
ncbi:TetR/AcrR family transcriptional regulator [Sneathiella chinensis]|uniref:TetR family transcriptional regulator n=1 Tax=Sneathiella chinensis TaxID=349750 RepID=A0ABQ5U5L8_9PROT|nr:TetR/AcrR family transcriptional regulator [Sneathiella chinensis]GLQ06681.1 TetR family transcriptional regulator [Sneathiella chinensis]